MVCYQQMERLATRSGGRRAPGGGEEDEVLDETEQLFTPQINKTEARLALCLTWNRFRFLTHEVSARQRVGKVS